MGDSRQVAGIFICFFFSFFSNSELTTFCAPRGWVQARTSSAPTSRAPPRRAARAERANPSAPSRCWCRPTAASCSIGGSFTHRARTGRSTSARWSFWWGDAISCARIHLADGTRRCLPQGFGYRWLRSKDVMDVGGALRGSAAACPVVKQLLGWTHVRTFSSSSATLPRQT